MEKATIRDGSIVCSMYGKMTGIDCNCNRNEKCRGCFINTALDNIEKPIEDLKK